VYDALGRLVEVQPTSGSATQIVYAPDGWKFAYMNGQTVGKYVAPMAGGVQVVYTAATPAEWAYYRHADWLGSERLASTVNRGVQYGGAYAPFGESYAETGTTDRSFTGQTQDVGSGLYDFTFRQYSAAEGRWLVPDPAGQAAVDITNPQTWNRYAYLANNPLNAIDPLGLYDECGIVDGVESGDCLASGGGGGGGGGGVNLLYGVLPPPDISGLTSLLCGGIFCNFNQFFAVLYGAGGGGGNNICAGPHPPVPCQNAANNDLTPQNPCLYQGNAMSPTQYAVIGTAAAIAGPIPFLAISATGFPRGSYLDAQPEAEGNVSQRAAYGNYAYGVYMAAAGVPYSVMMGAANMFGTFSHYTVKNGPMDPVYTNLPNANVTNITRGYNDQRNGTTCHP